MKSYYCMANDPDGIEIEPRSLSRVRQGKYWVPDCVDYTTRFKLPRRIKSGDVFAGWSCHNCKFLEERLAVPKKKTTDPLAPSKAVDTVTRHMVSEQVAHRLGILDRHADRILVQMFATITDRLGEREPVMLKNFGKFKVRRQKGRRGRHPSTGAHISIPDRWIVRFLPSKSLNNLPTDQEADPHPAGASPMKRPL